MTEPGIDVRRLPPGTGILLETDTRLYEFKVINPSLGLVEISSTDPALHQATVGQLLFSTGSNGGQDWWIGKGLAMRIRFRNGVYASGPVASATVRGKGWHYDVF
jgi:hypothetical protein